MGTSELLGQPDKCWRVTCDGLASHTGGVTILLAHHAFIWRVVKARFHITLYGKLNSHFTFYRFYAAVTWVVTLHPSRCQPRSQGLAGRRETLGTRLKACVWVRSWENYAHFPRVALQLKASKYRARVWAARACEDYARVGIGSSQLL